MIWAEDRHYSVYTHLEGDITYIVKVRRFPSDPTIFLIKYLWESEKGRIDWGIVTKYHDGDKDRSICSFETLSSAQEFVELNIPTIDKMKKYREEQKTKESDYWATMEEQK